MPMPLVQEEADEVEPQTRRRRGDAARPGVSTSQGIRPCAGLESEAPRLWEGFAGQCAKATVRTATKPDVPVALLDGGAQLGRAISLFPRTNPELVVTAGALEIEGLDETTAMAHSHLHDFLRDSRAGAAPAIQRRAPANISNAPVALAKEPTPRRWSLWRRR